MNKVKLNKEILAELREESAKGAGTYAAEGKAITIDDFKTLETEGKYGTFRRVEFQIEGQDQPFRLPVRGNREVDEDLPISIQKFVAQEDYKTSDGQVIPKGKTKWFATQSM